MMWAEALVYTKEGESLYLSNKLETYAKEEQSAAMEQDDREGLVMTYLDTLLPADWDSMDIYQRKNYISDQMT